MTEQSLELRISETALTLMLITQTPEGDIVDSAVVLSKDFLREWLNE